MRNSEALKIIQNINHDLCKLQQHGEFTVSKSMREEKKVTVRIYTIIEYKGGDNGVDKMQQ